jgi:hypothetical protein
MPIAGRHVTDRHQIVRQLRVVRGTMKFVGDVQPRFDYARMGHTVRLTQDGATFTPDEDDGAIDGLTLHVAGADNSSLDDQGIAMEATSGDGGVRITRTLRAGQSWGVVLESNGGRPGGCTRTTSGGA